MTKAQQIERLTRDLAAARQKILELQSEINGAYDLIDLVGDLDQNWRLGRELDPYIRDGIMAWFSKREAA